MGQQQQSLSPLTLVNSVVLLYVDIIHSKQQLFFLIRTFLYACMSVALIINQAEASNHQLTLKSIRGIPTQPSLSLIFSVLFLIFHHGLFCVCVCVWSETKIKEYKNEMCARKKKKKKKKGGGEKKKKKKKKKS